MYILSRLGEKVCMQLPTQWTELFSAMGRRCGKQCFMLAALSCDRLMTYLDFAERHFLYGPTPRAMQGSILEAWRQSLERADPSVFLDCRVAMWETMLGAKQGIIWCTLAVAVCKATAALVDSEPVQSRRHFNLEEAAADESNFICFFNRGAW